MEQTLPMQNGGINGNRCLTPYNFRMLSPYENIRRLADLTVPTRNALKTEEDDWAPNPLPITVAAGIVGASLASEVHRISAGALNAVFTLAESLLTNGDEMTSTAVATGFLEALLAQSSKGKFDFHRIGSMLGEESKRYCREWDRFTGVRTEGLY